MNREQIFVNLYGRAEVAINIVSGCFMLLGPRLFLQLFAPPFEDGPFFDSALTLMLVRTFGYMVITLGMVQFAAVRWGNKEVRQWLLVALLIGDALHFVVTWFFFFPLRLFHAVALFTLTLAIALATSRGYFLLTGVPAPHTDEKPPRPQTAREAYAAQSGGEPTLVKNRPQRPVIDNKPKTKKQVGGTIGELSSTVGYDVRDLMVAGYEMSEILEVAHGHITLEELFKRGPRKRK